MANGRLIWVPFPQGRAIALKLQPSPSLITPQASSGPDRAQDWRDIHIPADAMALIVHPMDVGVPFLLDMAYRLRHHPGPIAIVLESRFLSNNIALTPITPIYGSIGCEFILLDESDPMTPALAFREAIDGCKPL
jgi:hypothetical protein